MPCHRSLLVYKLPTGQDTWQVPHDDSFQREFRDGNFFLQVITLSFSCWMLGCCRVRIAYHCIKTHSEWLLKLILYSSDVKFPFPRRAGVGEMELSGFRILKHHDKNIMTRILRNGARFQIKCTSGKGSDQMLNPEPTSSWNLDFSLSTKNISSKL